MKRPMWELEWQQIKFRELGVKLKFFKRASSEFYSRFYSELFNRYESFDDLPSGWRHNKIQTAEKIAGFIERDSKVLSYGCGLGFIEREIGRDFPRGTIEAYDFADTASRWLKEVESVSSINVLEEGKKYDFVYCAQLFYAMNDVEIDRFAASLVEILSPNGKFLTVDTSLNPLENGVEGEIDFKFRFKNALRPVYSFFRNRKAVQFWGWERDNKELVRIFAKNGYYLTDEFSAVNQSFQLFELNNSCSS